MAWMEGCPVAAHFEEGEPSDGKRAGQDEAAADPRLGPAGALPPSGTSQFSANPAAMNSPATTGGIGKIRALTGPAPLWSCPLMSSSPLHAPMDIDLDGAVPALSRALGRALRAAVDAKAKPLGALGRIEELAIHIGLIAGSLKPDLGRAAIVVFPAITASWRRASPLIPPRSRS